jgi:uncharacterized protein (TIGR01319 family)
MKGAEVNIERVIVTDCGSTTTKALFFAKTPQGWRTIARGEAPTTVEDPIADVTVGLRNAFLEVQQSLPYSIVRLHDDGRGVTVPRDEPLIFRQRLSDSDGIDLYLSTSSAGGGLQMVVTGLVGGMSASSAARAALGAGAIVMDIFAADDGRDELTRLKRLRHLRPDIVLLAGGTDGGASHAVVEMAELLLNAAPRPRFGSTLKLPVIFAGNRDVSLEVVKILRPIAQIAVVENVRPVLEKEQLTPARNGIHEFFLSHVMSHSPGYDKLLTWTSAEVIPTPAAVGKMVEGYGERLGKSVLCVDIGGATTDIFSYFVVDGDIGHKDSEQSATFHRTVSANLGMSYSIANVLKEAGVEAIARWLPFEINLNSLRDELLNKMIRPTSLPYTEQDLLIEQAVCREALRLSLDHHLALATGLTGIKRKRSISQIFSQNSQSISRRSIRDVNVVIGSGGVLSHAPKRQQTALMLLEGFALEGITELAVDSIFMMPHLGVLSGQLAEAAWDVFERDCLVHLGLSVVPIYPEWFKIGEPIVSIQCDNLWEKDLSVGEFFVLPISVKREVTINIKPLNSKVDIGRGSGVSVSHATVGGGLGVFCDGRNRPIPQAYFSVSARKSIISAIDSMSLAMPFTSNEE